MPTNFRLSARPLVLAGFLASAALPAQAFVPVETIKAQCSGAYLMMACRPTGSGTLSLLAASPRADVLYDMGTASATHNVNGVGWYYSPTYSWGFVRAGDSVARSSCDTDSSGANDQRLCWHTDSNATLSGGYRCGATMGLNGANDWERVIYHSSGPSYYNWGPQLNVSVGTVTSGGWTQCFVETYSGTAVSSQTITFNNPGSQAYGTGPTLSASASSGLAVTFTSSTTGVCTVTSGGTLTFLGVGPCTVNADQAGNGSFSAAPQVSQTFSVVQASQSITFGGAPSVTVGGTGVVSATGGGSGNAVTFTSQTTGVCTISGTTVTGVTTGTCTIAANQAGSANYSAAPQVTQGFAIAAGAQAALTATATPASIAYGGTSALGNSGGSGTGGVSYAVTAGPGFCSVAGGTLTGIGVGTCTVTATKAGDANYLAATATVNVTVGQASQAISFGVAPSVTVGGTGSVTASGGASGNAVTFASQTAGVCTISGSTVTGVTVGTCTIAANQAGNVNYAAAPQVTQSFAVGQGAQAALTATATPLSIAYGETSALGSSGGSGTGGVSYAVTGGAASCSVAGTTLTGIGTGTCTVTATKAADANYLSATASVTVTVIPASQSIVFGASPSVVVDGTGTVTATGGASGNAVTFTSQTVGTCTVSGSTVTGVTAGPCTIAADQAGSVNYSAAPQVTQTFAIGKGTQAALVATATPATIVFGTTAALGSTGGSGTGVVSFAVTGGAGFCSVAGGTLTGIGVGTCTVMATKADDANYLAATATVNVSVGQIPQSIAFAPAPLLAVGGSATVSAAGGASGNPVTFTSLTTANCTVSGSVVSAHRVGTCRVAADQAGSGSYAAAPQATLDISAFVPPANMTALWWNPEESGWGLFVNHQATTIHAAIFTYATDGEPMWLVGSNVEWQPDGTFAGTLYRTAGPRLGEAPWPAFQVTPVGEIAIAFEAGNRATLRYTYREGGVVQQVAKAIQRMDFQPEVPACVSSTGSRAGEWNVQDLWWNPVEPGWGLDLAHQGPVVFGTIFTYDTAGRDLWLVASRLERRDDGSWYGDLLRTSSPGFDPLHWKGIAWRKVGTLEFHPVDGETGHAIFTVDGVYVEKPVRRMVYGSTVPACR